MNTLFENTGYLRKKNFFCVISVNVQVISISEKYVLDFTFPSQFVGFETISY